MAKNLCFTICLAAVAVFGLSAAEAQPENKATLIAQGQYFSIYADGPTGAYDICSKLKFEYLVFGDSLPQGPDNDQKQVLVKTIDGLFLEVSDIIDIHLYSFKGSIHFVPDRQALASLIKREFSQDFNERSLYYFEKNTIYISLADLTTGMLGHEIAHAIISNYFIVPPPAKVQEIISGYVEYSLNKLQPSS